MTCKKMPQKKICHLVHKLDFGGIETIVRDFSTFDPDNNIIVTKHSGNKLFEDSLAKDVPVYHIGTGPKAFLKLVNILKKHECDLICSHVFYNIVESALLSMLGQVKVLQVLHNEYPLSFPAQTKYTIGYNLAKALGVRIIGVSKGVSEYALNVLKIKNTKTIYNGLNEDHFYFPNNRQQSTFTVAHMGSFTHQKNHSFIIDIFSEITKRYSNTQLLLLGDGKLRKDIEAKVKSLNLEDKVTFTGNVVDVPKALACAHCFLFPSHYEGFGKAAIEAMSMGIVPILSNYPAAGELITNEQEGFIVNNMDTDAYADCIARLIESSELRERMSNASRKRVVEQFSLKKMINEYQSI